GVAAQLALCLEPGQQAGQGALELVEPQANGVSQPGQAPGQVGQVLEQKAILRQALDDQVQEQPVILGIQLCIRRRVEQGSQFGLEAPEQLHDQRFLAMEVVIEIAGADAHFGGNLKGGNVGFALL